MACNEEKAKVGKNVLGCGTEYSGFFSSIIHLY
jgi:hypothetical protein